MTERIYINPKSIVKISHIQGPKKKLKYKANKLNYHFDGTYMSGDWDINCKKFKDYELNDDFLFYIKYGHEIAKKHYKVTYLRPNNYYNWDILYNSIINNGYIQSKEMQAIEIAIGRNGEYFFVDGRHRLVIALYLNMETIPVDIVYKHVNLKR